MRRFFGLSVAGVLTEVVVEPSEFEEVEVEVVGADRVELEGIRVGFVDSVIVMQS